MRLTGPYYRITVDHGTMYVPAAYIASLRPVVGKLCECARLQPQNAIHAIDATEGNVKGVMFPSSVDGWHVVIRLTMDALTIPYWLTTQELRELNVALSTQPLPGERTWMS